MRQYRLTMADLLTVLAHPAQTGQDDDGNALIDGRIRGQRIRIVIAEDDPTSVITVFERRR